MMNDTNGNGDIQDEPSLSGISFPSLNLMYSHEENDIIPPNDTIASSAGDTCSDSLIFTDNDNLDQTKVTPTDITKQILSNSEGQTMVDHFMVTSNEYEEYDDYPTDENTLGSLDGMKEKRLNLLQLAIKHLVKKEPVASTPKRSNISGEIPHINVINESHTVDDIDGDSFLGNVDCTNVENSSILEKDDTSFLESAAVQDAPTLTSVNEEVGDNDVESYYNIHASTLSRASISTKASTIGDKLLKESYMASNMARNDNINLLADNQSSTTTSKYSYKRAFENVTLGGSSTYDCSALTEDYCYDAHRIGLGLPTERVDIKYNEDTGQTTPNRSSDMIDETDPNHNEEHLTRVLSYGGEVEGYVDEEAACKYSPAESRKGASCCTWFTSSTRFAKLIVLCSLVLLFVSVASVSLALLMPEEEGGIASAETVTSSSTLVNSTDEFDQEDDVTVVDNDPINQMNSSDTLSPSMISVPSVMPSTLTPSKSPQAFIYLTSEVIDSQTDAPVLSPSFKPSTKVPTWEPSNKPTTLGPSQTPTESQIITNNPTQKPITSSPTSKAPTTTIQTLPEIVTIQSRQETYIDSSEPDENFGTSNRLRVDGSPRRWTLIKFDISSISNSIQRDSQTTNRAVKEAKLQLYPTDSGGSSTVYVVPSSIQWSETSVTWNNFASVDASDQVELGSIGWVNSYQWKEVDVSSTFTSGLTDISDTITFLIKSRSTNGVSYRVGPFSPRLELTIGSDDNVVTSPPSPMPTTIAQGNTPYPTYTPTARLISTAPPSPEPSKRTRAPHKRPLPTTNSPSGIPVVKSLPKDNMLEESKFVPPGCSANQEDIDLVMKQVQLSEYGTHRMHVVFSETTKAIILDSSDRNVLLEFNLGMIALTSAIYSVVSVKLRLFVDSVDEDTTLSVLKFSNELDEGGNDNHTFRVTSSDVGKWKDIDVTDLIDHRQISKLVLTGNEEEANGTFVSGSECHSSKLIVITER